MILDILRRRVDFELQSLRDVCEGGDFPDEDFSFAEECANGRLMHFSQAHFGCPHCNGWDTSIEDDDGDHECASEWKSANHKSFFEACHALQKAEQKEYAAALAR